MSRSSGRGRLGNQIIRNLASSLISEKFDLYTEYSSHEIIKKLGINLYIGKNKYHDTITLNDSNYFDILDKTKLNANITASDYFQTKQITNCIYRYLHSESVKTTVIKTNSFKERYSNNNDIYIHIRLGDVSYLSPGLVYFVKAIELIENYSNIYVSTDEMGNDIIKRFIEKFPNTKFLEYDEIQTIQFASTCKHIILSHGSFSAIIGYLSYYSKITYPDYRLASKHIWFGDMFSIDGWNKLMV
jgi:hypothetical protein